VFLTGDSTTNYFITAAHTVNTFFGTNGQTGDTVWQPTYIAASTPVAFITNNPAWSTSCGTDPNTGLPYDYCPIADVMLGTYANSVTGQRALGTSDYEGLNGAAGSQHIHGWYAIEGVAIPEYLPAADTGEIHKSGFRTGTTTGGLVLPVVQISVTAYVGLGLTPKDILYTNMTLIDHIGWGGGDSGSPVFAANHGSGDPFYALGILALGLGHTDGTGICDDNSECQIAFARWSDIESALGLGTLDPTSYP
jgi:hypothetical protein